MKAGVDRTSLGVKMVVEISREGVIIYYVNVTDELWFGIGMVRSERGFRRGRKLGGYIVGLGRGPPPAP